MKHLLLLTAFALGFHFTYSQKVFVENVASRADVKVYIETVASRADKKVFYVNVASRADLKIFFTDVKSRAGWRNNNKKHLML